MLKWLVNAFAHRRAEHCSSAPRRHGGKTDRTDVLPAHELTSPTTTIEEDTKDLCPQDLDPKQLTLLPRGSPCRRRAA
jgi:hypothetical protein